jgi:hypothetical protein
VDTIGRLAGSFTGAGSWHDAAGKSETYTVVQTQTETATGFEVQFRHDFADGSVVEAHFVMTWVAPLLFRVESGGASIGNGYCIDDTCHYHLKMGDAFVEVSYRIEGDELRALGSSTKNAEGLYIAWQERSRRS